MKDVINYRNFMASVHFSQEDDVFYGKLVGINDSITFEGQTVKELKDEMAVAVEDYLEICKEINKEPHKSYKGSLNVRINPQLHQRAAQRSTEDGISLNQLIEKAIATYVE
jgi:predicted HicB family RNase H-like nuclease